MRNHYPHLFHRNELSLIGLSFSTISAVFESIDICSHELLINYAEVCLIQSSLSIVPSKPNVISAYSLLKSKSIKLPFL